MSFAEELLDLAVRVAAEAERLQGVILADVRVERVESTDVTLRDGVVERLRTGVDRGAAIRVFVEGGYGFSYATRLDYATLRRALDEAYRMARAAAASGKGLQAKPYLLDALEAEYVWPVKRDLRDVPLDAKIRDLVELDKLVASRVSEKTGALKTRTVRYMDSVRLRVYASTEGRRIVEEKSLAYLYVTAVAREGDVAATGIERVGTTLGYAVWEKKSMEAIADTVARRVAGQLRGRTPRPGNYPVVMAPEVIGVFVHEAFGHLTEADLALSGSILRDKLGEKVASELVTIVDDPGLEDGFGTYRFDDEGVRAVKATLVEKGVLRQFMTDRIYASILDTDPTGNARAESFRVPPLIRMRNTVMLPGEHSVEELFEGIEFGYYLVSHAGGQANLDGNFQVGVQEAYEIVNGEVGEPVRQLSISGNTIETLLNIDAVAKDFELHAGWCGKIQLAPVSDGGPHVRVKRVAVGGRA